MKLTWKEGNGPVTLAALADEVEREGKLGRGLFINWDTGLRCLWGVINDGRIDGSNELIFSRRLSLDDYERLAQHELSPRHSDNFEGTTSQRCREMVRRLRAMSAAETVEAQDQLAG